MAAYKYMIQSSLLIPNLIPLIKKYTDYEGKIKDLDVTLNGMRGSKLFHKLLDLIESGISSDVLRENPLRYLLSGRKKKIVVNLGGEGLKVSCKILEKMAALGDEEAKTCLETNRRNKINRDPDDDWMYFESE